MAFHRPAWGPLNCSNIFDLPLYVDVMCRCYKQLEYHLLCPNQMLQIRRFLVSIEWWQEYPCFIWTRFELPPSRGICWGTFYFSLHICVACFLVYTTVSNFGISSGCVVSSFGIGGCRPDFLLFKSQTQHSKLGDKLIKT